MTNKRHNNGKSSSRRLHARSGICTRAKCSGFTLIESILALALSALIAGVMYQSLTMAFRARRSADEAYSPVRRATKVSQWIRDDLESATVLSDIPDGEFLSLDDGSMGLRWLSTAGPGGATAFRRVELRLEDDPDGSGQILVHDVITNILAPELPEPDRKVLCRGVRLLELTYYDGYAWREAWDSRNEKNNALPEAIRVKLAFDRPGKGDDDKPYSVEWVYRPVAGKVKQDSDGGIQRRVGERL